MNIWLPHNVKVTKIVTCFKNMGASASIGGLNEAQSVFKRLLLSKNCNVQLASRLVEKAVTCCMLILKSILRYKPNCYVLTKHKLNLLC